jgi:tRNA threonylcarbamoyladenosine biosynthesis protein TsaB
VIILTLRTDQAESKIALYNDFVLVHELNWQAHRTLADTIHIKIKSLLDESGKTLNDIHGLVCFRGPGSFTGLRIGLSLANALTQSLNLAIVGTDGALWQEKGIQRLIAGQDDKMVLPHYGSKVKITKPKK